MILRHPYSGPCGTRHSSRPSMTDTMRQTRSPLYINVCNLVYIFVINHVWDGYFCWGPTRPPTVLHGAWAEESFFYKWTAIKYVHMRCRIIKFSAILCCVCCVIHEPFIWRCPTYYSYHIGKGQETAATICGFVWAHNCNCNVETESLLPSGQHWRIDDLITQQIVVLQLRAPFRPDVGCRGGRYVNIGSCNYDSL